MNNKKEFVEAKHALEKSKALFDLLIDNAKDMIYRISLPSREYEYVSPSSFEVTGYFPDDFYSDPKLFLKSIHPDWRDNILIRWEELLVGNLSSTFEFKIIHESGKEKWIHQQNAGIMDKEGRLIAIEGIVTDVTEGKQTEIALKESEEHYKNFYENALVGLFRTRMSDGMYIAMNAKAAEQQGLPVEEIVNKVRAIDQYKNPEHRKELLMGLKKYGEVHDYETELMLPNGNDRDISISVKAYPDRDYMEGVVIDITERKKAEKQLKQLNRKLKKLVLIDPLTDSINRKPFMDLLEKIIFKTKKEKKKLALLFMDLENFKQVNDIYGHDIGDLVLQETANKIRRNIMGNDLLGRIGGDEFVVCLNDIKSISNAVQIAQTLNEAFSEKMMINDLLIDATVSIGISIYPDDAEDAVDLLNNSDIAMYKAKNKMKNSFQLYNKNQKRELIVEQALLYALENEEFSLHYQPIVNSKGQCASVEALLRWTNPNFGSISPSVFIPLLEKNKEIIKVGKWVFSEVCKLAEVFNKNKMFQKIKFSVNLSQIQMEEYCFVMDFHNIIKKTTFDGNNILLEITEHESIQNPEKIKNILTELKSLNIGTPVLDDFGVGYSSFTNLLRFPVEIIKLDKFLIDNLCIDRYCNATINMIHLIKALNLKVVAEGVETKEQFEKLSKAGCDYYQGYYFSKPVPNIYEVLERNNGNFL